MGTRSIARAAHGRGAAIWERHERTGWAFLVGVWATTVMSVPMLTATVLDLSPMPAPIPVAAVKAFGPALPQPLLAVAGLGTHLAYGGLWAAVLVWQVEAPDGRSALALAVGLWIVMGLGLLPALGWGPFGIGVAPQVAVATLVLHLLYGVALGWGLPSIEPTTGTPR